MIIVSILGYNLPLFCVSKLESDQAFIEFKSKLNSGWNILIKKDLLQIVRNEPVLVMPVNRINAPVSIETEKEKLARMKKYGMKMKPTITYRFKKRWTVNDAINADLKREETQTKIQNLQQKYKIEYLLDKNMNRKGGDIYTPKTKSEKRKVKEYFNEKEKLERKIPILPDYHLEKFSLFFISKNGISNEYSEVFPESVTGEFIQVEKLLFKYKTKQ